MKKLAIASALFSAFFGSAHAYQAEVRGAYDFNRMKEESNVHTFNAEGTYYFNPVQVRDSPLAEAAFLDRASNVGLNGYYGDNSGVKKTNIGISGEYFVPNTDFYVGAAVSRDQHKVDQTSNVKTTRYQADVGYLPVPGLLVAIGLQGYDQKDFDDKNNDVDPTATFKYVPKVGEQDLNLEARVVFGNKANRNYFVAADYYLDKTLSLGLDYQRNKAISLDQVGVTARKFFTPQVSVDARAGFGGDYDSYTVGASYRF